MIETEKHSSIGTRMNAEAACKRALRSMGDTIDSLIRGVAAKGGFELKLLAEDVPRYKLRELIEDGYDLEETADLVRHRVLVISWKKYKV